MLFAICLGLFMPLLGFLGLMFAADRISRSLAGLIGCTTILISFICFADLFINHDYPAKITLYRWLTVPGLTADFSLHMDTLSLWMALIITGVGFLIHLYSIGYMDHEKDYARYFSCLNFFIFAMLLLVLAANLLLLFVGWEGVGLASYLLIGFWYEKPAAAQAATKAFVVNRIGDLGLLLGILLTFFVFGTTDIETINATASQHFALGAPLVTLMTLLYFIGATGKSAQLPLHIWLPDAMEGPTPVSALIHAATMVTAGVYLIVRMELLFNLAPVTLQVISVVGGATALFAALAALGQTDLKRVLAYSTVSQLGLMFLACGAAAYYSAMFHLTTHAFIKALLFLSAGNVVHMLHGTTEMAKMGGLAKLFPKTHWLFLIGVLAMSGVPPLAAFFSKDFILEQELLSGYNTLFIVALLASVLTAFYLTRAYCLTFMGSVQIEDKVIAIIQEAPRVMLVPVAILALLAIFGGILGVPLGTLPWLESFLSGVHPNPAELALSHEFHLSHEMWLAIGGTLLGMGSAAVIYTRYVYQLGSTFQLLKKGFFIDQLYDNCIVKPLQALSRFIDEFFEPRVLNGSIRLIENSTKSVAKALQYVQSGQIRSYVAWMAIGSVVLGLYFWGHK